VPGRYVHRVELTDLEPGRPYWFVVGDSVSGFSPERDFRTIPDTDEPLRFIAAGDTGVKALSQQLQAVAAAEEPLFVLLGGDLAYTNGDWNQWPVWDQWLDNWQQAMVTPSGFTVPMVSAIGNHEVAGGYGGTPDDAPIYLKYLAQALYYCSCSTAAISPRMAAPRRSGWSESWPLMPPYRYDWQPTTSPSFLGFVYPRPITRSRAETTGSPCLIATS